MSGRRISPLCLTALAGCGALLLALGAQAAQPNSKRASRRSHAASTAQSAPDVTGTLPNSLSGKLTSSNVTAAPVSTPDPEVLRPYYLPDVPRERMRACGESWHTRKMAGETGDDDWRDFATKCLADSTAANAR